MTTLLAIDTGLHECGTAYFVEGELRFTKPVKSDKKLKGPAAWLGMAREINTMHSCDVLVIESQQVYRGALMRGDPNDLIQLAAVKGAIIQRFAHLEGNIFAPKPSEWKGQVPKDVHHERILKRLSHEEQKLWPKNKNARDAIGLGLWKLGRLK